MIKKSATDKEILEFVDYWTLLLEKEDYFAAFNLIQPNKGQHWTPEMTKLVIKSYGDNEPSQKITQLNNGLAIDGADNIYKSIQRKEVTWIDESRGYIWYDLNIDNYISDLTATFDLEKSDAGIYIFLNDIHVM